MARIEHVDVENFKSYRGQQRIGPLQPLAAVIGPNGAGKSNLMDALSFVFGIHAQHLRGAALRDLVYRYSPGTAPSPLRCAVQVSVLARSGTRYVLKRAVKLASNSSVYYVGGKAVPWDEYEATLHALHIFPKARNFLVFQGRVDEVAQQSARAVTAMMEELSGSASLAVDYERLAARDRELRDTAMFEFQKRKGIAAEKKQFKEQKAEADKYTRLVAELSDAHVKHSLAQLFAVRDELAALDTQENEHTQKLSEVDARHQRLVTDLEAARKAQAQAQKKALTIQKKVRAAESASEADRPEALKLREEQRLAVQREKALADELARLEKQAKEQKSKVSQLRKDEAEVRKADERLATEMEALEATGNVELNDDERAEYVRACAEVERRTHAIQAQRRTLEHESRLGNEALALARAQRQQLAERRGELAEREVALSTHIAQLEREVAQTEERVQALKGELDGVRRDNAQARGEQERLSEELRGVHARLAEAKAVRAHDERGQRRAELVAALQRVFDARVHGLVSDLAKPKNRRYNLAVSIGLGKHLDSVVVQDERTALECIAYLKERRLGAATFLPLTSISAKPVDEALRSLGHRVLPIIDVLQFDSRYARAIQHVCGSTVVCETASEARRIAFGERERRKVVTVDGMLLLKSGLMTGGTGAGGAALERAGRWDAAEVAKLKTTRDETLRALAELGHSLRSYAREGQLAQSLAQAQSHAQAQRYSVQLAQEDATRTQKDINDLDAQIAGLDVQIADQERAQEERSSALEALRGQVADVEEELLGALSRRKGVENLRALDERKRTQRRRLNEQRVRLAEQRSRIQQLLDYESARDLEEARSRAQAELKTTRARIRELESNIKSLESAGKAVQKNIEDLKSDFKSAQDEYNEREGLVRDLRRQMAALRKVALSHMSHVNSARSQRTQLRQRRHALIRQAMRDDIELPLAKGSAPLPKATGTEPETDEDWDALLEAESKIDFDWSTLGPRVRKGEAALREFLDSTKAKIQELVLQIDTLAPNLRAQDHLRQVEARLEETNTALDTVRESSREAVAEFERVKEERTRLFMECFDAVAASVDGVYKELTGGGGSAYLTLEQREEPYLHGVVYTPMPPAKPFGTLDQLSGGEKAVAALALLFALAAYRPAPFFVLDEVDAALDSANLARVAAYLRKRSRETQFILISLKDRLYDKADGLVGVYVEPAQDSSATLTLDLTPYE